MNLEDLPNELLRCIIGFLDIPSIAAITCLGKNSHLSRLAADDTTWSDLIERRFRISTQRVKSRVYGGRNWKQSFHSLQHCNRIPRTRYTTKNRIVFAKKGDLHSRLSHLPSTRNNPLQLWVLLAHTENCQTRSARGLHRTAAGEKRYVQLYLCLQNVHSSGEKVTSLPLEALLHIVDDDVQSEHKGVGVVRKGRMKPKLLHHDRLQDTLPQCHHLHPSMVDTGIVLRPFEVAVVSVHFPCSSDVLYETDFLARARCITVPVQYTAKTGDSQRSSVRVNAGAVFLSEKEVWNYYSELPGGCLVLQNSIQTLAV